MNPSLPCLPSADNLLFFFLRALRVLVGQSGMRCEGSPKRLILVNVTRPEFSGPLDRGPGEALDEINLCPEPQVHHEATILRSLWFHLKQLTERQTSTASSPLQDREKP